MASIGFVIQSNKVLSLPYNGLISYNVDLRGTYYQNYSWVEDGDIPISYDGVNALFIKRNSNSATKRIYFDDLSSDEPADVIAWLEAGIEDITADLGVTVVEVKTDDAGLTYSVELDLACTFLFSSELSTSSALFGTTDISGTIIILSGLHIDSRPKFVGIKIQESSSVYAHAGGEQIATIISTRDDMAVGNVLLIPNDVSNLQVRVVRMNAPAVVCPLTLNYALIFQRDAFRSV